MYRGEQFFGPEGHSGVSHTSAIAAWLETFPSLYSISGNKGFADQVLQSDRTYEWDGVEYELLFSTWLPPKNRGALPISENADLSFIPARLNDSVKFRVLEEAGIIKVIANEDGQISNQLMPDMFAVVVAEKGTSERYKRVSDFIYDSFRDIFESTSIAYIERGAAPMLLEIKTVRQSVQQYFLDHPEDRPASSIL